MTIKMYQSYWRSVSKASLAALLLSSFVCNGLQAAASNDLVEQLLAAAEVGKLDEVKRLVELGADTESSSAQAVNAEDEYGNTPLHWAALLLSSAACTSLQAAASNDLGRQLRAAVQDGDLDKVKALMGAGAEVNTADEDGYTPLLYAVWSGHLNVVQYLVEQGAKVNYVDKFGFTPVQRAKHRGHQDVVEYLKKVGPRQVAVNSVGGEWRPRNHSTLPRKYRAAMTTLVILAKGRTEEQL